MLYTHANHTDPITDTLPDDTNAGTLSDDATTHPTDAQIQPIEFYQMVDNQAEQASTVNIEIHNMDVAIEYPDFSFEQAE